MRFKSITSALLWGVLIGCLCYVPWIIADVFAAPQPSTTAPEAVSVSIVVRTPNGRTVIATSEPGTYSVATVTTYVDLDGNVSAITDTKMVTIGESVNPIPPEPPPPDPVPPFPVVEPGPRLILIIAERDDQTPAVAALRQTLKPILTGSGHRLIWIDDDAITGSNKPPKSLIPWITRAIKTPTPDVFVLTTEGRELYSGELPDDAAKVVDTVKATGGQFNDA